MHRLVALDLAAGQNFVDQLERVWAAGDAVLPIDQRLPTAAKKALLTRLHVGALIDADHRLHKLHTGRPVEPGDALVMPTSGSTGVPKGVVLTHDAVAASADATSARLGVTPADHWLACLPLAHVGGMSVITRALHRGTALTVLPTFDAAAVDVSEATLISLVATAMGRIDTSRWRTIVLGGSRPPTQRPANTVVTYGMTETGSGVVYDGKPLDGVEVKLVDGEIWLRGPMLVRAYRDGNDPKTDDGWLPTGDLGEWDTDGRLRVLGRRGDLIITGGENVFPEPVEVILSDHQAVAEVAVIGEPDPEWGERVTALIVVEAATAAPSLESIRDTVKAHLAAYHAPRRVVIVPALPRTTLGKLKRDELPALAR